MVLRLVWENLASQDVGLVEKQDILNHPSAKMSSDPKADHLDLGVGCVEFSGVVDTYGIPAHQPGVHLSSTLLVEATNGRL